MSLLLAALVSFLAAWVAWRLRTLTPSGGAAALLVGTGILCATGWAGAAILGVYFAGSAFVSAWWEPAVSPREGKGSRRDAAQVLANGGPALAGAILTGSLAGNAILALWVVTGSLAAAAADTWATAAGARSRVATRDILRWMPVPTGTSGGVTFLGTAGALAGALWVSVTGAIVANAAALLIAGLLIGLIGMTLDSVLGSGVQGRFRCPVCDAATEQRIHRCGTRAVRTGGLAWLTNDVVNLSAASFGALAGWAAWLWWLRP